MQGWGRCLTNGTTAYYPDFIVMQTSLLKYLRCPFTKTGLELTVIKSGASGDVEEGWLLSGGGYIFPVIKGIPRMLPESFTDHKDFLQKHLPGYDEHASLIKSKYGRVIDAAVKRNSPAKKSFSFEWGLLKSVNDTRIWNYNKEAFKEQLFAELDSGEEDLKNKVTVDVGCGHGQSSYYLSQASALCIGMDLGASVEKAAAQFQNNNLHYIQADLHHPPFADGTFDVVYSSGVLHHTPDTANAFNITGRLCKAGGTFCVWLYHPFNNNIHHFMRMLRRVTVYLPLRLQFWLYMFFLMPLHKIISWLKGKPKSWREIMINQLDMLSPRYRFEHTHDEVEEWFHKQGYGNCKVTSSGQMGFSIKGVKSS